ncbi:MAG: hypothetical protein J0L92_30720 [Deltaproteobacteria bacterium]|nr:hypothetical protein [Deltaproteobacteria bacterium]
MNPHKKWHVLLALGAMVAGVGCVAGVGEGGEEQSFTIDAVYPPTVVGGYERVAEFLPDDEAAAITESFDWANTAPLPEIEPDGSPAVFYAVIRIDSLDHFDLLDEAGLPWSMQPLFDGERRTLPDGPLHVSAGGSHGGWIFTLIGGRSYNVLRDAALNGEPIYEIVSLRNPPEGVALNHDGSVDLETLISRGFEWPRMGSRDPAPGVRVEAISELLSDLGRAFIESSIAVADAVRDFFGWLLGGVTENAAVTFNLTISTPDADWTPVGAPLRRTWGPLRGTPIANVGQEVFAELVSFPFGTYRSFLGPGNTTGFVLPNGRSYRFCTRNRLREGGMINYWVPTTTCTAAILIPSGAATATVNTTLADQDLQNLTVANDGVQFLAAQQTPIRMPTVAVDNHAQLLAQTGNGYVIGLGGRDPASALASTALDGTLFIAVSLGFPALAIPAGVPFLGLPPLPPELALASVLSIRALMNVDIVWPPGNTSRLVFAHEFGHHAFYQFMVTMSPNPAIYSQHLMTIFLGTLASPVGPNNLLFEPMLLNEAMADVFADQLAGGGNRLGNVMGVYPGDGVGSGPGANERYCDPTFAGPGVPGCFDFNITGTEIASFPGLNGPLNVEASRVSTLLHDLWDDDASGIGLGHHGQVWMPTTGCPSGAVACPSANVLVPAPGPSAGLAEETVAVPFVVVLNGMRLWMLDPVESFIFATGTFMHGQTRALRLAGTSDAAICAVYGLHTPGGGCPGFWMTP